ncbi:MAG: ABC-2 type transport system ATP-binding protein [Ilumatobacter sp.]|jgi:ABC-2 type transport system ATP-binding protein
MKSMNSNPTNSTCEVRHLSKSYGQHTVVDDLTFSIPAGHVVGLIGPNGAGKTTTMKMLLGLVRPSGGEINLLDRTVGEAGWGSALKRVGSMIEAPPIYDRMTARQNLRYQALAVVGKVDDDEIDGLLKLVGLFDRADDRPRGYSLGMRQRLGIATTLIGNPELVILDEPGNGLDPAGILEIRRLMGRLPEMGTTVLVSSHQLAEVQQACDQLVILANGRTVAQGTTDEILAGRSQHRFLVTVDADEVDRTTQALHIADFDVIDRFGNTFVIEPPTAVGGRDINRTLVAADVFASTINQPVASLEDAFLDLVQDTPALEGATS